MDLALDDVDDREDSKDCSHDASEDIEGVTEEQKSEKRHQSKEKKVKKKRSGGINDHHLYREFRLQMVENFGSLAAAFFEVEMKSRESEELDMPTGKITEAGFMHVVCEKLEFFNKEDTDCLFKFVTDHSYLAEISKSERTASYKDFGIEEAEWKNVLQSKMAERKGEKIKVFASTKGGQSSGLYHRPMDVDTIATKADEAAKRAVTKGSRAISRKMTWQQPQIPWEPSIFAGGGPSPRLEDVVSRGCAKLPRLTENTINNKGVDTRRRLSVEQHCSRTARSTFYDQPSWPGPGLIGNVTRPKEPSEEARYLQSQCPTRRNEMALRTASVLVVEPWWPYEGEARNSPEARRRFQRASRRTMSSTSGFRSAR